MKKLPNIKILDESNKLLHRKCKDIELPLPQEDIDRIHDMLDYLEMSQVKETEEFYHLRAGMGLAYPQLGLLYRIFVIVYEVEEGKFDKYVVVNPKVKSASEEMVYIDEGEGCLSINRPTTGIVPRHARITIDAYDEYGNPFTLRVREELAVAFQHELDHLDGVLFTDKIDPKHPFKGKDTYRAI